MIHPRLAFHFTFYWLIAWWLLECTIFRMTTNSVCVCYPGPGAGHHVSCEAVRAGGTSLAFICYLHHNPDIDTGLSWTNNDLSAESSKVQRDARVSFHLAQETFTTSQILWGNLMDILHPPLDHSPWNLSLCSMKSFSTSQPSSNLINTFHCSSKKVF